MSETKLSLPRRQTLATVAMARGFAGFPEHVGDLRWIDCDRTRSVFSATGRMYQMDNQHFGTIPAEVTGNAPVPKPEFPAGGDQPRVNASSATCPPDVAIAEIKFNTGSALKIAPTSVSLYEFPRA